MKFTAHPYIERISQHLLSQLELPKFPNESSFSAQIGRPLVAGDRYYDATRQRIRTFDGTRWVDLMGTLCSA